LKPLSRPAAAALALALIAAACARPAPPAPPRILLIGVDGLEWSVIAPLIRQGELPHLRSLMERGAWGEIETADPTLSPVLWTTIATGKPPEQHGIRHFVEIDPGSRQPRLLSRLDRRVRAFWNILSDAGQRVHVVGWFLTYPAEPIHGFMVSQFASLDRAAEFWKGTLREGVPNQTHPESLLQELVPEIRAVPGEMRSLEPRIFGSREAVSADGLEGRLVEHTLWALEADVLYGRVAERILRSDHDFAVLAVYFGGPDVVGHRFWRYYHPEAFRFPPPPERRERFAGVIPNYYRYVDEWVGRLTAACGDGAVVLVVSDHGMGAINREVDFDRLERVQQMNSGHHLRAANAPGVIIAAGPGIRRAGRDLSALGTGRLERLGSVLDVTPTLLYLRDVPVGRDMPGAPMDALLDPAFRRNHRLRAVETHERPAGGSAPPSVDPDLEREMMERFKSLGYIGG
jgi:predicted AlkP superfamily pyrophosphatase or phosphodiesterase